MAKTIAENSVELAHIRAAETAIGSDVKSLNRLLEIKEVRCRFSSNCFWNYLTCVLFSF